MSVPLRAPSGDTTDRSRDTTEEESLRDFFAGQQSGFLLHADVALDGELLSLYLYNGKRNLFTPLFALPRDSVAVGDTWSLDVQYINIGDGIVIDSSFKRNQVRLVEIRTQQGDTVAAIDYNVEEVVVSGSVTMFGAFTAMAVAMQARGEFSVTRGRWLRLEGYHSQASNWLMGGVGAEAFTMTPVSLSDRVWNMKRY